MGLDLSTARSCSMSLDNAAIADFVTRQASGQTIQAAGPRGSRAVLKRSRRQVGANPRPRCPRQSCHTARFRKARQEPMTGADWYTALSAWSTLAATIVQFVALFVAILVLVFTYHQVRGVKDTLQLTALSGIVQLETYISDRKAKLDEASTEGPPEKTAAHYQAAKNTALENWLNAVDRLCFVIRQGYWPNVDWATEYEDYLRGIVHAYPDFVNDTKAYPNLLVLYKQWQERKPKSRISVGARVCHLLTSLGGLFIVLVIVKAACRLFGWPRLF